MSTANVQDFYKILDQFEDKEYLFYKIKYKTAPTIAGIKPSTLMTIANYKRNLFNLWEAHKEELVNFLGLRYYELKKNKDRVIVLFYQHETLAKCLSAEQNQRFLQEFGYKDAMSLEDSLELLKKRYEKDCPHELGIFLGYPLEDVIAFMNNKSEPCLASKYWRVYRDLERALMIFEAYDQERLKVVKTVLRLQGKRQRQGKRRTA